MAEVVAVESRSMGLCVCVLLHSVGRAALPTTGRLAPRDGATHDFSATSRAPYLALEPNQAGGNLAELQIADLFCGAGGASTGIVRAAQTLGSPMKLVAVNHWPLAVRTHRANHPKAHHVCQNLDAVRSTELVPSGHLDLLFASPQCTHHSKARGGAPVRDQSRATAWHVLDWATQLDVDRIIIENVPEFAWWGPVDRHGCLIKGKKGQVYQAFLGSLRALGYAVEDRVVTAADFGDPTSRTRLFIVAVKGASEVVWPEPTHGEGGGRLQPFRTAREIVDWDHLGRPAREKRRLAENTHARISHGLEVYGGEPFILPRRQFNNDLDVRSIDEPLHTITTGSTDIAVITPHRGEVYHRTLKVPELKRAMSFPADYILHGTVREQVRQIGNAVPCRVAARHAETLLAA